MTEKILIGEGELKGGLREGTQRYRINYMPEVIEGLVVKYEDKIEFAIITPGKEPDKVFWPMPRKWNYHSLRFTTPEQLRVIIQKLATAYAFFLKKKGQLNINNAQSLPFIMQKEIGVEFQKVLRGDY